MILLAIIKKKKKNDFIGHVPMLEACRGSTSQSAVFYLQQPTVNQFSKEIKY
jgi:hypothetical protein